MTIKLTLEYGHWFAGLFIDDKLCEETPRGEQSPLLALQRLRSLCKNYAI